MMHMQQPFRMAAFCEREYRLLVFITKDLSSPATVQLLCTVGKDAKWHASCLPVCSE